MSETNPSVDFRVPSALIWESFPSSQEGVTDQQNNCKTVCKVLTNFNFVSAVGNW